MKKITIPFLLLILIKLPLFSQSEFVPGYIQTTINDKVFGLIDYRGDKTNTMECRFKKTPDDTVHVFSPSEIYGYRFIDSKYYIPRQIKTNGVLKTIFMECLVEGTVNLYFYRDIKGDHYLIGKQNLPITEISLPDDVIQVDEKGNKKSIRVNWNVLKFYLNDCPEIFIDVDQLSNTQHKTLIQLIKKYHDISCPNDVCLIYQKKMPKFRVDIQPLVGYSNINTNGSIQLFTFDRYFEKYSFQYGLLSNFWLPLRNERLFFKTGIIVSRVKGYDWWNGYSKPTVQHLIKMPLHLQYQFSKNNIVPFVSGGANICLGTTTILVIPGMSFGINAKISNKMYASLSTDLDYWSPFFLIPSRNSQLISHSFNLGLAVKL